MIQAAPLEAYSQQDRAFFAFWYSHMQGDLMQPPLAGISHSTARYIWDSALATPKPEPMTWQPIETAPKDGAEFLGWRHGRIATARLVPRDDCEMWVFGGESFAFEVFPALRPTHWMPLPPAPITKEQA